ncbi:hypothetical protein Peur_020396 [Populus x canadensis]
MGNGCSKVLYIATDRPYKNSKPKPKSSQKDEECLLARGYFGYRWQLAFGYRRRPCNFCAEPEAT